MRGIRGKVNSSGRKSVGTSLSVKVGFCCTLICAGTAISSIGNVGGPGNSRSDSRTGGVTKITGDSRTTNGIGIGTGKNTKGCSGTQTGGSGGINIFCPNKYYCRSKNRQEK